jgi:hypothetical protein
MVAITGGYAVRCHGIGSLIAVAVCCIGGPRISLPGISLRFGLVVGFEPFMEFIVTIIAEDAYFCI